MLLSATRQCLRVSLHCADGVELTGHLWRTSQEDEPVDFIIVNAATGVRARYYHYYARFLADAGFDVLTYDYRGIGLSRPPRLRGCGFRWRDWGEFDVEAAIAFADTQRRAGRLLCVGHSIGGFLPGLAPSGHRIERLLTVGAQFAYWPDYARSRRLALVIKWHVAMPLVTWVVGYFPGARFGWLEDLPAGVAYEWSARRSRVELSYPPSERTALVERLTRFCGKILAISVSDDEFGTPAAVARALAYYTGAERKQISVTPERYSHASLGHFSLFHSRHAEGFWLDTLSWLRGGDPWATP